MIDSAKNIVCSVDTNSLDQKLLKKMMHKYNFYQDIVIAHTMQITFCLSAIPSYSATELMQSCNSKSICTQNSYCINSCRKSNIKTYALRSNKIEDMFNVRLWNIDLCVKYKDISVYETIGDYQSILKSNIINSFLPFQTLHLH